MLEAYDFLNPEECTKVRDKVVELKESWTSRGGYFDYPFYSLGAASYMDAVNDAEDYYKKASQTNIIINQNFDWLLEKVSLFITEKLGKPAFFHPRFALPGFHIFQADELFEIPVASRHVDLQYKLLDWRDIKFDEKDCISFTVYVRMPSAGGGLYLWDYTFSDLSHLSDIDRQNKLADEDYKYRKFEQGQLVIHDGLHFHQIAAMEEVKDSDERISLQGHAVLSQGNYFLYW